MVARILSNHNCGWYYRVVEEGVAEAGDDLRKVEDGHAEWSVARVFAALYDPEATPNQDELRAIAELDRLTGTWREKARGRLKS